MKNLEKEKTLENGYNISMRTNVFLRNLRHDFKPLPVLHHFYPLCHRIADPVSLL